jgi:8-oxo-dGTP pyrophosphatase MutT (NUDIX family)
MSLARRIREALRNSADKTPPLLGDSSVLAGPDDGLFTPAAVLVPIVERPEPGVILTLRTDTMRRHAGQVAFPGGRIDPEDGNATEAALREAEEEIGLHRSHVDVIGEADRYRTGTGFDVTPIVAVVPPALSFTPQPDEVAAVFEVPLRFLLEPSNRLLETVQWKGAERHYYVIMWEGRRIWGATAAMIVNLGHRLGDLG